MTLPSALSVYTPTLPCISALTSRFFSSKAWVYMSSVVETCECPSSPDTVATSAPPEIIRLAAVCRRLWTFRSRGRSFF